MTAERSFRAIGAAIGRALEAKTIKLKSAARHAKIKIQHESMEEFGYTALKGGAHIVASTVPGVAAAVEVANTSIELLRLSDKLKQVFRNYVTETGNALVGNLESLEAMADAVKDAMIAIYQVPVNVRSMQVQMLPRVEAANLYEQAFAAWEEKMLAPAVDNEIDHEGFDPVPSV